MITKTKTSTTILLAALLSSIIIGLVAAPTALAQQQQQQGDQQQLGAKPTDKKEKKEKKTVCNNVKIMAVVSGLDTTQGQITLTGSATLNGQTVTKTITVNATDPSTQDGVGLPLFFKKAFLPCPALGSSFSGQVNDVTFSGILQSLKSPNFVDVDLATAQ